MENVIQRLIQFATEYGLKIIGAILILIVGRIVASIVRNVTKKGLRKAKVDETLISFFGALSYFLVLAFTVVAALAKFGIQTTSFVAVLAAAGFAIGFALQGSLGNFAAGVMILIFRPYRVGDFIEAAGVAGVVKEVRIFSTIIDTLDNIKVIVPNGKIYGDVIKNVTGYDTRRVDLVIGIGYSSSMTKAMEICMRLMKEDEKILDEPAPQVAVSELADSSVNLVVRPWCNTSDYWNVKFGLTEKIKAAFDAEGIEIPFPQHSIHMVSDS
ncbi:mechanosensitive ion channel [Candidatus Poribacteria bacterium]|nr:mechanosensitive ion channel [Candidatus Poribacteria bacterium]